ncbi:MAG TPA: M56 family metallopeptidase [Dermatophilaceae bacterium]|nr:M56 family metallopeptidase [Dermatophilaceae bacterium]
MTVLALVVLAVLLAGPVPRAMARQHTLRRSPRAALVAWQSVSLAAILAALAAAPAAAARLLGEDRPMPVHVVVTGLAALVSALMLARLLRSGHRIGTRLRALRASHLELVDIIAHHRDGRVRVLAHPTPTAYCLPGRQARVVLSQGTLDALPEPQLEAVVAHERAHLAGRHDLLLEYFTVIHETVPRPLRCEAAMEEVRLLVEALADRASVRCVGTLETARALVTLAESRAPEAAMGAAGGGTSAPLPLRLRLLAAGSVHPALTAGMYLYAVALLVVPVALLAAAWASA